MEKYNIEKFKKGWFIGDFIPSLFQTNLFEAALKQYNKGQKEDKHYHKIATEFTLVVTGKIKINDVEVNANEVIKIEPNEWAEFEALEDSSTVVIKIPSLSTDKYF